VKKGATLKEGTARAILRQAGVSEDEFFNVYRCAVELNEGGA
jgi:hypothetical protein